MKSFLVTFKSGIQERLSAKKEEDIRTAYREGRYGILQHGLQPSKPTLESEIISIEEIKLK